MSIPVINKPGYYGRREKDYSNPLFIGIDPSKDGNDISIINAFNSALEIIAEFKKQCNDISVEDMIDYYKGSMIVEQSKEGKNKMRNYANELGYSTEPMEIEVYEPPSLTGISENIHSKLIDQQDLLSKIFNKIARIAPCNNPFYIEKAGGHDEESSELDSVIGILKTNRDIVSYNNSLLETIFNELSKLV